MVQENWLICGGVYQENPNTAKCVCKVYWQRESSPQRETHNAMQENMNLLMNEIL